MAEGCKHILARQELKTHIVDTAVRLFRENGIKGVTMDEVAASLTISKRTLYEVFSDKETLLIEVIKVGQTEADMYARQVVATAKNVLEVLLKLFKYSIERFHATNPKFFQDMKRYPKAFDLLTKENHKDSTMAVKFFHEGVKQGIFRDDINFSIVHLLMREQFNVLLHSDICNQYSFVEVYESIMFTHLRGISTERGAHELEQFILAYRAGRDYSDE